MQFFLFIQINIILRSKFSFTIWESLSNSSGPWSGYCPCHRTSSWWSNSAKKIYISFQSNFKPGNLCWNISDCCLTCRWHWKVTQFCCYRKYHKSFVYSFAWNNFCVPVDHLIILIDKKYRMIIIRIRHHIDRHVLRPAKYIFQIFQIGKKIKSRNNALIIRDLRMERCAEVVETRAVRLKMSF